MLYCLLDCYGFWLRTDDLHHKQANPLSSPRYLHCVTSILHLFNLQRGPDFLLNESKSVVRISSARTELDFKRGSRAEYPFDIAFRRLLSVWALSFNPILLRLRNRSFGESWTFAPLWLGVSLQNPHENECRKCIKSMVCVHYHRLISYLLIV